MAYKDSEKGYWVGETRVKIWTGETKKRKKRGFKTKREALEWENSVKSIANPSMEMTLEEFVEIYFTDKKGSLKERSAHNKRYMMERHIIPYFKGKKMNEITAQNIIQWQNMMIDKPYSETYLRMIQNQLTALFTHAAKIYDLRNNPCKKVGKIGKSDVKRLEFWTKDEYDQFIETLIPGTRYYVLFEILFWTGCRIGELLALTPDDIEFEKNIMHITKTYYRLNEKDIITTPKTENSVRDVVLPGFLADEIKDFIDRQYGFPNDARIFPIGQRAVQRKMNDQIKKANVSKIKVHGLRHSATAFLISKGVPPMVIRDRLGHKDIRVTLNTYGHLYPSEQQNVANMLDDANKKNSDDGNHQSSEDTAD